MQNTCKKRLLLSLLALSFFAFSYAHANSEIEKVSVQIPMRDGVELTTDLYIPKNLEEPPPCILIRTPGPSKQKKVYQEISKWGYAVAIQSLRSHRLPEDHPEPYFSDGWGELQDGYDTINWLGESEYTNGKWVHLELLPMVLHNSYSRPQDLSTSNANSFKWQLQLCTTTQPI